ncbi:Rv3235 family protein [Intrasporangium sp.]|uniref:Rv3235 family protein n=1 Tax=Intrasporangium sp. TaxID=1925024 RepID=UPI003221B9AE
MTTKPVLVRPAPATEPPVISAEEAYRPATPVPYTQAALALDFTYGPDDDSSRRPTRRSLLPDPTSFVAKMAQAIIEVIAAQRPAPQLIRHTSPEVYAGLARRALVAARRQPTGPRRSAMVRRVRLCEPADGIVEACAVVVAHGRVRALALRLEGLDGRWLVTQLTVG